MGIGGGDGRLTFFENWDEAKFEKYEIDPENTITPILQTARVF